MTEEEKLAWEQEVQVAEEERLWVEDEEAHARERPGSDWIDCVVGKYVSFVSPTPARPSSANSSRTHGRGRHRRRRGENRR